MKIKVIILCGGAGTRLKEETEYKPKPMVYVGNKPIVWHIMNIYSYYGFNDFILALGYKADYIKDFFLNQKAFTSDFSLDTKNHNVKYYLNHRKNVDNFKMTFVDTGTDTYPGERIRRCEKYIPKKDKYFMVTYGDGVTDLNIRNLFTFHQKHGKIGTITGVHPRSRYGLVNIDNNNRVLGFKEKPTLSEWVNGGYMVFKREFLNYIYENEYEHPALTRLVDKKELCLYKHNGFWYAVDTYKELEDLNNIWQTGKPPWKIWK